MLFAKFSIILIFLFSIDANSFTTQECLKADYEAKIGHKSAPFGLTETILAIQKVGCVMTYTHVKYNFIKSRWEVDACRGPVHIKAGASAVEVLKRDGGCPASEEFCQEMNKIFDVVQNDGLIFAPGDKEDLNSDHGKFFCGFELLKGYLEKGIVYSKSSPEIVPVQNLNPSSQAPAPAGAVLETPPTTVPTAEAPKEDGELKTSEEASPTTQEQPQSNKESPAEGKLFSF